MSTLYTARLHRVEGTLIEVSVVSLQPESCPFYETKVFALALLCEAPGFSGSLLAAQLPDEAVHDVSIGDVDPGPFVAGVRVAVSENRSSALYHIEMTRAEYAACFEPGPYSSVAFDDEEDSRLIDER